MPTGKIKGGEGTTADAFAFAGLLRARGLDRESRWHTLRAYSDQRHDPPISDEECTHDTDSVERYDPSPRAAIPEINITADTKAMADEGARVLDGAGIYQRATQLVRIITHRKIDDEGLNADGVGREDGSLTIDILPQASLEEELASRAKWIKYLSTGRKEAGPPDKVVKALYARSNWPTLPYLTGITEAPLLRPDGSLLDQPGYDKTTGLLYSPAGLVVPTIPDKPTADDVKAAVALIHHVVCDYEFQNSGARAAWCAWLLTGFARLIVKGPMPALLVDAPVRGSGKTMLPSLAGIIMSGRTPPAIPPPKDDEEMRKKITAIALAGDRVALIDNAVGAIGYASLDAALTSRDWSDRRLGESEQLTLRLDMLWAITGNQVELKSDLVRRVMYCRLVPDDERPETRSEWVHNDLMGWVKQNRGQLIAACLTILRAYHVAGRPAPHMDRWGSYDSWFDFVAGACVWSGLGDPTSTRRDLEEIDTEAQSVAALWEALELHFGDRGFTAGEILNDFLQVAELKDLLCSVVYSKTPDCPTTKEVGYKLKKLRDRRVGGRVLVLGTNNRKGNAWRISTEKRHVKRDNRPPTG